MSNFEFLQAHSNALATLGATAEILCVSHVFEVQKHDLNPTLPQRLRLLQHHLHSALRRIGRVFVFLQHALDHQA